MTDKQEIAAWFDEGKKQKATHMIVVCDTFDHDNYPVFVSKSESVRGKFAEYNGKDMQRAMEVYNLQMPKQPQLDEYRAFHFETTESEAKAKKKKPKACRHKKKEGLLWCYECGAKRAGPKPEKTVQVGWYAIPEDDDHSGMEYPGRITSVRFVLLGQAVEKQSWSEEVTIVNHSEHWTGPAEHVIPFVGKR